MRRHVLRNALQPTVAVDRRPDRLPVRRPRRARADLQLPGPRPTDLHRRVAEGHPAARRPAVILVGIIYMVCDARRRPDHRLDEPPGSRATWRMTIVTADPRRPPPPSSSTPRRRPTKTWSWPRLRLGLGPIDTGPSAARPARSACGCCSAGRASSSACLILAVLDRLRHRRRPHHALRPASTTSPAQSADRAPAATSFGHRPPRPRRALAGDGRRPRRPDRRAHRRGPQRGHRRDSCSA